MDSTHPGAFVSYTSGKRDADVAHLVGDKLKDAGFDVWEMGQGSSVGSNWRDEYEREVKRRHVLVAIVSSRYLSHAECRNEVRIAHGREVNAEMLIAPVIIESIDASRLDEEARQSWDNLRDCGGLAERRIPDDEEVSGLADRLRKKVIEKRLWSPSGGGVDEAPLRTAQVELPLDERWTPSRRKVLLTLRERALGAKPVRAWLVRNAIPRAGLNRWEVEGTRYESEIRASLIDVMSSATGSETKGDARA
jgi:hypothetical protein